MTDKTWFDAFSGAWDGVRDWPGVHFKPRQVYCVTEGAGMPVKIGITADLYVRVQSFIASTWRPLHICWCASGRSVHENAVKAVLRPDRMHGEWYADPSDDVKNALRWEASTAEMETWINAVASARNTPVRWPREARLPPVPILRWQGSKMDSAA